MLNYKDIPIYKVFHIQQDQRMVGQIKTRMLRKVELKALFEARNIPSKGAAKELTKTYWYL
jgi:hypothetical protein